MQNSCFPYLFFCPFSMNVLILHHFDCHCFHVAQADAFRNFPKRAFAKERPHHISGDSRADAFSSFYLVGLGRWVDPCK